MIITGGAVRNATRGLRALDAVVEVRAVLTKADLDAARAG